MYLKACCLSRAPLTSTSASHGILHIRFVNKLKSAPMKSVLCCSHFPHNLELHYFTVITVKDAINYHIQKLYLLVNSRSSCVSLLVGSSCIKKSSPSTLKLS